MDRSPFSNANSSFVRKGMISGVNHVCGERVMRWQEKNASKYKHHFSKQITEVVQYGTVHNNLPSFT
jgi:hypothetical protein